MASLLAIAPATPALAHGALAADGRFGQLPWNWETWVLVCLGLSLFGYVRGLARLGANARARVFGALRVASFLAGLGTLFFALISPFDALDDQLFAAHMVQHLLLMMVAAPLLVWSRPAMAMLWAFPLPARRVIGRAWTGSGLHGGMRALMSPWLVWALCSAVLWFWHLPGPYGWALQSAGLHTLEHFCFFVTALMFWSLVLEPFGRRRLDYGSCMIFVATLGLQNGMLGALLTLAGRPFYAAHLTTTAAWGLTPLQDQQLAGVIMWIPAGLIHLCTLGVLFVAWMRHAEREACRHAPPRSAIPPAGAVLRYGTVLALGTLGLSACSRQDSPPRWIIRDAQAERAPALLRHYGCAACHSIPGVNTANGQVGPPLVHFGERVYIAGVLPNNPDNLIRWVRQPQQVIPGNAMPNTGVSERDARDIAAYLYTLQ